MTEVNFREPVGATLQYQRKTYTFPATVKLSRPSKAGEGKVTPIRMTFPTPNGTLNAEGKLTVFGFVVMDVDYYSTNDCAIATNQIEDLRRGYAVVIEGITASGQPQYRFVLGQQK
jgi:hypothetical protein